jgi:IS30 family transposase
MLPTPRSQPRKPGRPRALDDTKRREICALISAGCGIEGAARYVGCAASTVRREGIRNPEFGDALRRAHLSAELAPLQLMREFARKYWRAAAWLLERTNPQRFAKQNVRLLKPEQLGQYTEMIRDIIRVEVHDEDTRLRVARRLQKIAKWAEQESWAQNAPIPKMPKRPKGYRPRNS